MSATRGVDRVGLRSSAQPDGSPSSCAATAEPASATIRRSDASLRTCWNPFPPRLNRPRRPSSASPTRARIAYEPRCPSCLARSPRRWPPVWQALAATRRLLGLRIWSAAATFDALASAGRPSRHRARSPQRWIGSKRGRATSGSSGNAHGSADRPPARHRRLTAADQVGSALQTPPVSQKQGTVVRTDRQRRQSAGARVRGRE